MTGKEILIKHCQEHDAEEIYSFLQWLRNESRNYTDSRRYIIEWLKDNHVMKKVTKEEYDAFIENYPRKLKSNFFMDWIEHYDFPYEPSEPMELEELYSYKVARHFLAYDGKDKYYIKSENEDVCPYYQHHEEWEDWDD